MGGSAAQGISATQKREKEKAAAIAASKLTANVKLATAEAKALMAAAKTYSNPDVGFKFLLMTGAFLFVQLFLTMTT